MKRERFFELLGSPYFPYIAVELIYIVISIIFNFKLRHLNELLYQNFDIDRMVLHKNVVIATDVMGFDNNASYEFLIGGILLIIIAFIIPIVSSLINKSSYKDEEVKLAIWLIISVIIVTNVIVVIFISKALFSPIIIATLILCAAGSAFAIGGSSQT
ncbi:MAG: hypothetical protein SOV02_02145 [Streptococcus infantarius]|nr:hypothetical protein [Streptococcus pasteurianus]MDY2775281.1 hypothetical protein [Streptococcus infantarius]